MNLYIEKHGIEPISLVFFHGWGFDSQIWRPLLPQLMSRFTVYLVDLPGFGFSDNMKWDEFKFLLLRNLPSKFITVGWSLGGAYAMRLAIEEKTTVSRFISISASPRYIADKDWPGITKKGFDNFMQQFLLSPETTLHSFLKLQAPNRAHLKVGRMASLQGLNEGLTILKTWDLREALKTVSNGNFILGRLDVIVPAKTEVVIKKWYPQFDVLMMKHAAHMPFLSDLDKFIEYLHSVIIGS